MNERYLLPSIYNLDLAPKGTHSSWSDPGFFKGGGVGSWYNLELRNQWGMFPKCYNRKIGTQLKTVSLEILAMPQTQKLPLGTCPLFLP